MANDDSRAHAEPTCNVCGDEIPHILAELDGHCGEPACEAEMAVRDKAKRDETRDKIWTEMRGIVSSVTGVAVTGATPYQNRDLVAPSQDRIDVFAERLTAAITEAFEDDTLEPDIDPNSEVIAAPSKAGTIACTACQGSCCAQGKATFAFVGPRMMARQRMIKPGITAEELHAFYMDSIPEKSTEDACLYQSDQGCVLDRTNRAQVCNEFKCWSLKAILEVERAHPDEEIAIGAVHDGAIQNILTTRSLD